MKKTTKTAINLNHIDNITNINQITEYYNIILEHVRVLGGYNKEDAEDLTQELFINLINYLNKYPDKIINGGFISVTARNMIRNKGNKDKQMVYVDIDYEDKVDNVDTIIEDKLKLEELYTIYEDRVKNLHWYEQEVLKFMLIMPLTTLSKKSGISYQSLRTTKNKIMEKLSDNNQ